MVLLDAASASCEAADLVIATFDHGTGPASTEAAGLVEERARTLGLTVERGFGTGGAADEASLRAARWAFLRRVSAQAGGAPICTAHTEDDQIETVLIRIMRGAHARGIAGLYAPSLIRRPLLDFRRRALATYARVRAIAWIEDPTNASTMYLRNRVRHELLPALRRADASIDAALLDMARRAAEWRGDVDRLLAAVEIRCLADGLDAPASLFSLRDARVSAKLLWPAIAARAGATLDRRALARLASFTEVGRVGSRIQLAGGWEVVRARSAFQLRRMSAHGATLDPVPLSDEMRWGAWCFRPLSEEPATSDLWSASLPANRRLFVRPWRAGDAMIRRSGSSARKVKRLLTDAGVTGHLRAGWPVVVAAGEAGEAGDDIVWIPGVGRNEAATARSGWPGLTFACEYDNR